MKVTQKISAIKEQQQIIRKRTEFYQSELDKIEQELATSCIELEEGRELEVMIRPEFIEFAGAKGEDNSQVHLAGSIQSKRFVGERIFYEILVKEQVLQLTVLPPSNFEVDEEVELVLDINNLWFMEV